MKHINEAKQIEKEDHIPQRMAQIKHKIIVMSGKGGVGKTSIAVNLAYGLATAEKKVGLLDTDFHGPNIAKMLGLEKAMLSGSPEGIEPVRVLPNLEAVSVAFMGGNPDQPIVWRGPLKMAAVKQLLGDVKWGALDYLVIDSPPGTGDEPLSVCQLIPGLDGAIIVTTPQDMSVLDARKTVLFARQLNIPVIGIVENMSGFVCPHCGEETQIFKTGGGEKAAQELHVPFLGRIPFEPEIVELADRGEPFISGKKDSATLRAFRKIQEAVEEFGNGK
jgi:ATP-binding protein involved in chromosome partitioning